MPERWWPGITQVTGCCPHRVAHPHVDVLAGAKPAPARTVLHLDRDRAHTQLPARLERPRELHERRAAQ